MLNLYISFYTVPYTSRRGENTVVNKANCVGHSAIDLASSLVDSIN